MGTSQVRIVLGMAAAVAVLLLGWQARHWFGVAVADETLARLVFALRCLLVPGLCLLAGIGMVANRRFFLPDAIDGGGQTASRSLDINLRYNRNTLEQTVLVLIAWPLLALFLPVAQLGVLVLLAVLFGIGRVTFWLGYLYAPWARAFGFGLTFYPSVAAYLWLIGSVLAGQ
jgi:hypothetical protein